MKKLFDLIDKTALANQRKVLDAFIAEKIEPRHFAASTGYGYGDVGREALCRVFARCMGAESAIVSPLIASGTHAIAAALFGVLRPGGRLVCATGQPYDTLRQSIWGDGCGSLKDYGIKAETGKNYAGADAVFIGRSRGYEWRETLSVNDILLLVNRIKKANSKAVIIVDNCYGEFVETREPCEVGADLIAGSLIKNPGGGLAPTGGYIAGRAALLGAVANRLTAPGIGGEVGSCASGYLPYFQGLFTAPHVTAGALKASVLFRQFFAKRGYEVSPKATKAGGDIIAAIKFNDPDKLLKFARIVQANSPVDSAATPTPWDMPGYEHQVVMAAGAFVQGASIELSADAPMKPPYIAYVQGALTLEHAKLVLLQCEQCF